MEYDRGFAFVHCESLLLANVVVPVGNRNRADRGDHVRCAICIVSPVALETWLAGAGDNFPRKTIADRPGYSRRSRGANDRTGITRRSGTAYFAGGDAPSGWQNVGCGSSHE